MNQKLTTFSGRYYILVDVNPYFYNCGHYPQWAVEGREGFPTAGEAVDSRGRVASFGSREEAEEEALRRNRASSAAWHEFLSA